MNDIGEKKHLWERWGNFRVQPKKNQSPATKGKGTNRWAMPQQNGNQRGKKREEEKGYIYLLGFREN